MQTKFTSPVKGSNRGSCLKLATYLEKENGQTLERGEEHFFSADRDRCNKWEVVQQIDQNGKGQGLSADQDRFYSILIAPSSSELAHIGQDSDRLKEYTRQVMENYAQNFNRGLSSGDLVWYAKVEHQRTHTFESAEVKAGMAQAGALKAGDQRHVHIIVSRCAARENIHVLQAGHGLTNAERTLRLSPLTNQRGQSAGAVKSGFDRDTFFRTNERSFDERFGYERRLIERYEYCNALKNGSQQQYEQTLSVSRGLGAANGREMGESVKRENGLSMGL